MGTQDRSLRTVAIPYYGQILGYNHSENSDQDISSTYSSPTGLAPNGNAALLGIGDLQDLSGITRAKGSITVCNAYDNSSHSFPIGTRFQYGNFIFTADSSFTVPGATYGGGFTTVTTGNVVVAVTAQTSGSSYNVAAYGNIVPPGGALSSSGVGYSLPDYPTYTSGGINYIWGVGGTMSGGDGNGIDMMIRVLRPSYGQIIQAFLNFSLTFSASETSPICSISAGSSLDVDGITPVVPSSSYVSQCMIQVTGSSAPFTGIAGATIVKYKIDISALLPQVGDVNYSPDFYVIGVHFIQAPLQTGIYHLNKFFITGSALATPNG